MKTTTKILSQSGTFNLDFSVPDFSNFGIILSDPHVVRPFPEDGYANLWLRLKIGSFSSAPHNIFFNALDNIIYPRTSDFDGWDGWMVKDFAPAMINQSADNSVYQRQFKEWPVGVAIKLGILIHLPIDNILVHPTSTVTYEAEGWIEH